MSQMINLQSLLALKAQAPRKAKIGKRGLLVTDIAGCNPNGSNQLVFDSLL